MGTVDSGSWMVDESLWRMDGWGMVDKDEVKGGKGGFGWDTLGFLLRREGRRLGVLIIERRAKWSFAITRLWSDTSNESKRDEFLL